MQIRHILIEHFRGIKFLDWTVPSQRTICLIGKGDSTKSTILDAIEYVLSPRWSLPITDADFYACDTSQTIEIHVTVGDFLPDKLSLEDKFGLYLRWWGENGVTDEPSDDLEVVLTVKLSVSSSLEPEWTVYTRDSEDGKPISSSDREKLGAVSVGGYVDRELSWGRGSALSRLTADRDGVAKIITDAHRIARENVRGTNMPSLDDAARRAQDVGANFGLSPQHGNYRPALDTDITGGLGALTLHDGDVPVRMMGLGSKRLLSIGMQETSVPEGAILLLDEVEQGLEPFRVRNLLQKLHRKSDNGQIFMTTHSTVVIDELAGDKLFVVRTIEGTTTVNQVPFYFRKTLQNAPEAPLAAKIIVCEGDTEYGVCRALDTYWENLPNGKHFAYLGVVPIVYQMGGGTDASASLAKKLAQLGYDIAFLVDADKGFDKKGLEEVGVDIICWSDGLALEQRVCEDLPWEGLQEVLNLALENSRKGKRAVLDRLAGCFNPPITLVAGTNDEIINSWLSVWSKSEVEIRNALGMAAGKTGKSGKGWFKDKELGQLLGDLIVKYLPDIPNTDLAIKLEQLRKWAYGN